MEEPAVDTSLHSTFIDWLFTIITNSYIQLTQSYLVLKELCHDLYIHINLLHPKPSLPLYRSLVSLWCYFMLVKYYFQVFFDLKVLLFVAKITQIIPWLRSFKSRNACVGTMHEVDNAAVPFKYTFIHSFIHSFICMYCCFLVQF